MKEYRLSVIDWKKNGGRGRIIRDGYFCGLRAVRSACPVAMHYSKNAGVWIGYSENMEYLAVEV